MKEKEVKQIRNIYISATLFTLAFGIIYEIFSHHVYSAAMLFSFMIPLVMGVAVFSILLATKQVQKLYAAAATIYNSGVATLTVGSIFAGVLKIYGTTNGLLYVYPVAGILLVLAGALITFLSIKNMHHNNTH